MMNTNPLSFSINAISNILKTLTKKNFKQQLSEIKRLINSIGFEFERHFYRFLFEAILNTPQADTNKLNLFQQLYSDLGNFFEKSNFVSILQFSFKPSLIDQQSDSISIIDNKELAQKINDLCKCLKLSQLQKLSIFICLNFFDFDKHVDLKKCKFQNDLQLTHFLLNKLSVLSDQPNVAELLDLIRKSKELIEYKKCAHTTVIKDLCAECGMDLRKTNNYENNAYVSMIHSVPELKVSVEQAQKLGKADEEKLLSSRKLVLLVDLDQTLIHTTNNPEPEQIKNKNVKNFRLYNSNSQLYFTKLRPFTNKFLESISKLYELHICTFGARLYAHKIAEILDTKDKKFFSHRILSRDECFDPQLKTGNLKALFPCGDSMVCIIDDREDVWNYQENLISVKPYTYFRNTGDINSPNKQKDDLLAKATKILSNKKDKNSQDEDENKSNEKSVEEKNVISTEQISCTDKEDNELENIKEKDENLTEKQLLLLADDDDNDDYLLYLLEILKKIHKRFYKEYDEIIKYSAEGEHIKIPDLKQLIPSIRREILKGCNIVFTGLIPTKLEPEQSRFWNLAKQLGANVSRDLIKEGSPLEKTTHLIASNLNTFKVQEALKLKCIHVVNPFWLYNCSQRWERVDERLYSLEKADDFKNLEKLSNKLSFDEQLFLSSDLVKLTSKSLRKEDYQQKLTISKNQKQDNTSENKKKFNPFPVYDPVTGKMIRNQSTTEQQPTTSKQQKVEQLSKDEEFFLKNESENITPHNMLELNPLAAFSDRDLKMMDEEVDNACSEGDESSLNEQELENEQFNEQDDDEENNLFDYGDEPVFKKHKKDCLSESSSSLSESSSNLSLEDSNVDIELGAQLEKDINDFLG